jgi:hypothetical protein
MTTPDKDIARPLDSIVGMRSSCTAGSNGWIAVAGARNSRTRR